MLLRWMSGPKYPTDGEAKAKMIIYARSSAMQFAHAEQARRFYEVAGTTRDHQVPKEMWRRSRQKNSLGSVSSDAMVSSIWYAAIHEHKITRNHSLHSRASLGLHRGCSISWATSEDRHAHGTKGPDPRMPARTALVFSPLRLGRLSANRCKLFIEGQQGCAATLL